MIKPLEIARFIREITNLGRYWRAWWKWWELVLNVHANHQEPISFVPPMDALMVVDSLFGTGSEVRLRDAIVQGDSGPALEGHCGQSFNINSRFAESRTRFSEFNAMHPNRSWWEKVSLYRPSNCLVWVQRKWHVWHSLPRSPSGK